MPNARFLTRISDVFFFAQTTPQTLAAHASPRPFAAFPPPSKFRIRRSTNLTTANGRRTGKKTSFRKRTVHGKVVVLAANAIAGSCYVRKACLTLTNDSALCDYKV